MRVIIGLPIQIIARGDFVARQVDPSPAGDGQLWFMDFDRCSLEAVGLWEEIKSAVLSAALPPADVIP